MATAQETLHSLGHLPWVQEAWEGKKETGEEGPTPVPRQLDGCPWQKEEAGSGRAVSPHQDATLEFLATLHPTPPPHPVLWGSLRASGMDQDENSGGQTARWLMQDSQHSGGGDKGVSSLRLTWAVS